MSTTSKILLNVGLNISTNNISVTITENNSTDTSNGNIADTLRLDTTVLSYGYHICIYDSTTENVFSNFTLNNLSNDIITKMLLALGTIFDINPNFQTISKGSVNYNVYKFISYPNTTLNVDFDVFKISLKYFIELLILSSSKNIKFSNSLINNSYPFFQLPRDTI